MDWIIKNKEWLFSGIGVTLLLGLLGLFFKDKQNNKKNQKTINSGNNSINIQGDKNIKVTIGDKNDK